MGAANSRAFGLPGAREMAMGYQAPKPFAVEKGGPRKTGGMRRLKIVELSVGSTIVRFGSKRLVSRDESAPKSKTQPSGGEVRWTPRATLHGSFGLGSAVGGAWWLEEEEFGHVRDFATASGITISEAVSTLCVIPPEWSDIDVLITARLTAPLLAYRGLPNPVDMRGAGGKHRHMAIGRDHEGRQVRQLYIPGLGSSDVVRSALMCGVPTFLHPLVPK